MHTTMTESGKHVSRPVALQEVEFDGDLRFFGYDSAKAVQMLAARGERAIRQRQAKRVDLTVGEKRSSSTVSKAERLWAAPLKTWFPDGLDTWD